MADQPDDDEKTSVAYDVLLLVADLPDRTTEELKLIYGLRTQTISARLSDLKDAGLIENGPTGTLRRNRQVKEVQTFRATALGADLRTRPRTEGKEAVRAAMQAIRIVSDERARALAQLKKDWRQKVASAARTAALTSLGFDLNDPDYAGMI